MSYQTYEASSDALETLKTLARRRTRQRAEPPPAAVKEAPPTANLEREISTISVTSNALPFEDAAEWLQFVMPDVTLYRWQYETLRQLSGFFDPRKDKKHSISTANPLRYILPAANGSGKDMVIIAGWATWYAVSAVKSKVVGTSSSDDQLKYQTEPHIVEIAKAANQRFGRKLFEFVEHYIAVPELGSEIKLFATNDAGRAEGAHPRLGGRMALFMNEAKTIAEPIWDALTRCSGYDTWLEISSPGYDTGHFYDQMEEAKRCQNVWPNPLNIDYPYMRKITGADCPHLTKAHYETLAKRGTMILQSSWFAEPMSNTVETVIPRHLLDRYDPLHSSYDPAQLRIHTPVRLSLDIGAGVDSTCLQGWRGNELIFEEKVCERNVIKQLPWFKDMIKKHNFRNIQLRADDNGVGQGLVDAIELDGCVPQIIRIRNQQSASDKSQFLNMGAELYANLRNHAQLGHFRDLPQHIIRQLSVRRGVNRNGKLKLFPKHEDKPMLGGNSPDSGDAVSLAWYGILPQDISGVRIKQSAAPKQKTVQETFNEMEHKRFLSALNYEQRPTSFNSFIASL